MDWCCEAAKTRRASLTGVYLMVREMHTVLEDRQRIADLMTGWIHRDLAEWDKLRELFHPDGTIEISWFEGLARDFVDGSIRMGESNVRTKHFISAPVVTFNGD